jgi:hypothetical protein
MVGEDGEIALREMVARWMSKALRSTKRRVRLLHWFDGRSWREGECVSVRRSGLRAGRAMS